MSPHRVTVRFPDGQREYMFSERVPDVGDVLRRNGDEWAVEDMVKEEEEGSVIITVCPHILEEASRSGGRAMPKDDRKNEVELDQIAWNLPRPLNQTQPSQPPSSLQDGGEDKIEAEPRIA
jgi:hypothetical protein